MSFEKASKLFILILTVLEVKLACGFLQKYTHVVIVLIDNREGIRGRKKDIVTGIL